MNDFQLAGLQFNFGGRLVFLVPKRPKYLTIHFPFYFVSLQKYHLFGLENLNPFIKKKLDYQIRAY